jgi:hypothetical protein
MQIDIPSLDTSIKEQLPLTLQIEESPIHLTDLPPHIQKLIIERQVDSLVSTPFSQSNIVDASFDKSVYNDVKTFNTVKSAIIEYIRYYLLTPKGTYPFDPEFGNELKKHLQTRDTSLRKLLLESELHSIVEIINNSFSMNVSILGSKLTPIESNEKIDYLLDIKFLVDDTPIVYSVA